MNLNKAQIKELCSELLADFNGVLSFSWDSSFNALLAEFPTRKQDEVRRVLEHHLSLTWDSKSIRTAPPTLREPAGDLADLRNNQLLFTTDPAGHLLIFAAWWPWGNGELVSVRIAAPAGPDAQSEPTGVLAKLKRFFA